MTIKSYKTRAIKSGNTIEFYFHKDSICTGLKRKPTNSNLKSKTCQTGETVIIDSETGEILSKNLDSRGRSNVRSRNNLSRLIRCNFDTGSTFITLTFDPKKNSKEYLSDVDCTQKSLRNFIRKIRRKSPGLEYVVVLEFTKEGIVHYHMLCNIEFIPAEEFNYLWGHGFVEVKRVVDIDGIVTYFRKYLTKKNADPRLLNKKIYQASRGLKKAKVFINEEAETMHSQIIQEGIERNYFNTYLNKSTLRNIEYEEYRL